MLDLTEFQDQRICDVLPLRRRLADLKLPRLTVVLAEAPGAFAHFATSDFRRPGMKSGCRGFARATLCSPHEFGS
jgi:hypothetical protein